MKYFYTFSILKRYMYFCFLVFSMHSVATERGSKSIYVNPFISYNLRYSGISLVNTTKLKNVAITITGTVRDVTGDVLPGVNIRVKGANVATTTDMNGKYVVSVT